MIDSRKLFEKIMDNTDLNHAYFESASLKYALKTCLGEGIIAMYLGLSDTDYNASVIEYIGDASVTLCNIYHKETHSTYKAEKSASETYKVVADLNRLIFAQLYD